MYKKRLGLSALLVASMFVASCSSDDEPTNNNNGGTTGSSGGSGGGSQGNFFNDDEGLGFANSLGESLTRLFSVGTGSLGGSTRSSGFNASPLEFMNRARSSEVINCDSGSINLVTDTNDSTGEVTGQSYVYDGCVNGDETGLGAVHITSTEGAGDSGTITFNFDEFGSTANGETATIDGSFTMSFSSDDNGFTYSISGPNLVLSDPTGVVTFSNFSQTISLSNSTGEQSIAASATITDGNGTITININPALTTGETDLYPTRGQISMTHSDGSSLVIDADNGNPETFAYVVGDSNSVTSGTERWDATDLVFDE